MSSFGANPEIPFVPFGGFIFAGNGFSRLTRWQFLAVFDVIHSDTGSGQIFSHQLHNTLAIVAQATLRILSFASAAPCWTK